MQMPFNNPTEPLYRAIKPAEDFWRIDGESVTSAAFWDKRGLSVDRLGNRSPQDAIDTLHNRPGYNNRGIVSVTVQNCLDVEALPKHIPLEDNPHHSEIHGNEAQPTLSKEQRKRLARAAIIELGPTFQA